MFFPLGHAQPGVTGIDQPLPQFVLQLLSNVLIGWIIYHVLRFQWIFVEVKEFKLIPIIVLIQCFKPLGGFIL